MTARVAGVFTDGTLELLEEPQGLRNGRVTVTIDEESVEPNVPSVDRRAFLRLPLSERRKVLSEQADRLASHYEKDIEWKEWSSGDIVDY